MLEGQAQWKLDFSLFFIPQLIRRNRFFPILSATCLQIKRCKTDAFDGLEFDNPERPECTNLLTLYQLASGRSREEVLAECASMRWGTFKPLLTDALVEHLRPLQTKKVMCPSMENAQHSKQQVAYNFGLLGACPGWPRPAGSADPSNCGAHGFETSKLGKLNQCRLQKLYDDCKNPTHAHCPTSEQPDP
eukprot:1144074-Pelagomonas_calceolata.AAC.3